MRTSKLTQVESIFEIGKRIQRTNADGKTRKGTSIVDGKNPAGVPDRAGYFQFTPEQLLSVLIEPARYDQEAGELRGYQRGLSTERCRRIARDYLAGKKIEPPIFGLDGGRVFCVEGKHRAISAVMANKAIFCVVEPMTETERAELYSAQSFQVQISRDNLIFSKQNPLAKYVKEAIAAKENGSEHPWRGYIDMQATSDSLSLGTAYAIIGAYSMDILTGGSNRMGKLGDDVIKRSFKKSEADQLGELLRVFGTKKTNPDAFNSPYVHAITDLAVLIKRQQGMTTSNIARWVKYMPSFRFSDYPYARGSQQMRHFLILHWNKRLAKENRIREEI